jgi:hypothetical protein
VIVQDLQVNTLAALSALNDASLFVAPWCKNMITSLKNHRLEMDSEEENARYKDFSDALRIGYAGIDGHKWKDPIPKPVYQTAYAGRSSGGSWMGN